MHDRLMALAEELVSVGESPARPCPDPVNTPMIRNWTDAIGDDEARWRETAPPAMIQVWSMVGLGSRPVSVADEAMNLLEEAGYSGVVATNCDHTYDRYVRVGEHLAQTVRFGGVTGPKRTALGEGYFVTWYQSWYSGDERVAEMMFRVLRFKPRGGGTPPPPGNGYPLRPLVGQDTAFFWDGVREGELRVQRCAECGALRHPPGPMCPRCHATKRDHITASGRGTVHSHVVHHHPPIPGLQTPFTVVLVDLEEGVRMVGNLLDGEAYVGMPVEVAFQRMDDDLTLPQWRPLGAQPEEAPDEVTAEGLPPLSVDLTPTFVISTALATRDLTPVHHDPALARAQGSADIFLNILTTVGLTQRYVLEQVPDARLAGIDLRLGVPAYAGDTLTMTGDRVDEHTIAVRGRVSLGDHIVATVRLKEAP
jgi:uncharacterized protein